MHIPRFFLPASQIDEKRVLITEAGQIRQITRVLRLQKDSPLIILDGAGLLYRCRLDSLTRSSATALIESREAAAGDSPVFVTVALSLLKNDRFDWAVEKMTEVGVSRIIPLTFKRSVARIGERSEIKTARWQRIARESAEQSERATIPQIVPVLPLAEFTARIPSHHLCMTFVERLDCPAPEALLSKTHTSAGLPRKILLVIGPEGGFTGEEISTLRSTSFEMVSLGPRILRSESAAICGASRVVSWCERHLPKS